MNGQNKIRILAGICWSALLFLIYQAWSSGWRYQEKTCFSQLLRGTLTVISGTVGVIALHISVLPASRYTPAGILILQYVFNNFMTAVGMYFSRKHEKQTRECQAAQGQFLLDLLSKRAETAYGKDNDFDSLDSVASFRQRHPLTRYPYFATYMDRTAQGEQDVLIPGKPLKLSLSSGTSGDQKLILQSKKRVMLFAFKFVPIGQRVLRTYFTPNYSPLLKTCYLYTHTTGIRTSGGSILGPTTMLNLPNILYRLQYSTPPAGMHLTRERQAVYVHLLFGLRDRDLQTLFAIFAATLYYAFTILEQEWPRLVIDLRDGRISDHIELEHDVKVTLEKELTPEPARASELKREFERGFDDIARRIWPRMESLWGVTSGSMTVYDDIVQAKYIKGLPIVSMIYNSTEGLLGVLHGKGEQTEYVTFPGDMFYEFIPFERSPEDQPDTLLATEVSKGALYELVITTMDGLYRYRLGDVVRVTGFYNNTPLLEYRHRVDDVLNIAGERTPETLIKDALRSLSKERGLQLVDYTTLATTTGSPNSQQDAEKTENGRGFYTVIAEFDGVQEAVEKGQLDLTQLLPEMTSELDDILRRLSGRYDNLRGGGSILPLGLVLVGTDAFGGLRSFIAAQAKSSSMQVKVPKVVRNSDHRKVLLDRKLS